ncbi:MAG: hypothetical protein K2K43_03795 [Alistipes sp.]|nr:hypothetical protein [Alistipes sp.]
MKSIIEKGFRVHFCKEEVYSDDRKNISIGIPMTCFCDIPLAHLSDIKYAKSKVGIGMKRTWGIAHKLQPVIYYPNNRGCQSTQMIIDAKKAFEENKSDYKAYRILGLAKPLYDLSSKNECNYMVREWRKIYESRNQYQWKTRKEYDDYIKKNPINKRHIGSPLKFDINDIDFIIVEEKNILAIHEFIMELSRVGGKELVKISQADREMLLSKIIGYETLIRNI